MRKVTRKLLRAVANRDPDYYDMYADANEACFAQLYLAHIRRYIEPCGIPSDGTVLDAGCQAGRLAVPLAQDGFRVTGVDTSGFGLRRAKDHAQRAGVTVDWVRGDLLEVLPRWNGRQFDVVMCAEVVYLVRRHEELLRALAAAVRPGGLLMVSHRPRFYYLCEALKVDDLASARYVVQHAEGPFRDSAYYNWQSEDQLRALYEEIGMEWLGHHPIDRLAWLGGFSPSALSEPQRARWLDMELNEEDGERMCGRYVLVASQRPA